MKSVIHKSFFFILFTFFLATVAAPLAAQVYKVVDEDGNVTYTDQAPMDGSSPVELRPISVIEAPTYEKASKEEDMDEDGKEMSLSYLRKNFKDFAIVSPQPEESVWRPDGPIPIAWSTQYALQDGMQVVIYLDGKRHIATTQQMIGVPNMDRGEHSVKAELRDSKNRIIATAAPVVFFVRQPGLFNRAVSPNGGG